MFFAHITAALRATFAEIGTILLTTFAILIFATGVSYALNITFGFEQLFLMVGCFALIISMITLALAVIAYLEHYSDLAYRFRR